MALHELITLQKSIPGVVLPENILELMKEKLNSKTQVKVSESTNFPKIPLPYFPGFNYTGCIALRVNHKLFTPCCSPKVNDRFCKGCEKHGGKYGTLEDRKACANDSFRTPNGEAPSHYGNVMEKLNISRDEAISAARQLEQTLTEDEMTPVKLKRGRKKKTPIVSSDEEETEDVDTNLKKRGRPVESKKIYNLGNDEQKPCTYKSPDGIIYIKSINGDLFDIKTGEFVMKI